MQINTDYFLPAELTGYVRAALADQPANRFQLARWLPHRNVDDLEYRFNKGAGGLIEAAAYRAFDAESPVSSRPGLTRVTGELPPISRKIRLGEYDRLRQRANPSATVRAALLTDAERLTQQIAARFEVARGDALVNGSLTISENGVSATVDFGRVGTHSTSAGIAWSTTASAVPLANMLAWRKVYVATNGEPPGACLFSDTVLGYLLLNDAMRALDSTLVGSPSILTVDKLQAIMRAHGLPPFYIYDTQVKVNGSATRIIPENVFLFLPAPVDPNDEQGTQLGASLWGTTAESLDARYGLAGGAEPGIVAGIYDTDNPIALWTNAAAIGLPILANPDLTLKATVAA